MKNIQKHLINIAFSVILLSACTWLFFYFFPQEDFAMSEQVNSDEISIASFKVTPINTKPFLMKELKGKVVIINIWATWCGPCRLEIPDLIELKNTYSNKLEVIGLSVDSSDVPVRKFIESLDMKYPVSMQNSSFGDYFANVSAIPTTYILDTSLNIKYQLKGYHNKKMLEELIVPLFNE